MALTRINSSSVDVDGPCGSLPKAGLGGEAMRATISTTIALLLALAFGCPAAPAQVVKSNQHQEAIADNRAAQDKANPNKDEAKGTIPAPPEVMTIEGTEPVAREASPMAVAQKESTPPAPARLYTLNSSAEVGWRFLSTDGNFNQFRSDLNFDRGIRLLSSDFLLRPTNGGGVLFDSL